MERVTYMSVFRITKSLLIVYPFFWSNREHQLAEEASQSGRFLCCFVANGSRKF
jgi:hypothetical protein